MSDAVTPFDAVQGEGAGEPIEGEGGEFLLPENFVPHPPPPTPIPRPVPIVVCPGVECCDPNPFAYFVPIPAPSLSLDNTVTCSTCYNAAYSNKITATGLGVALTWTITSGSLPPGLVFHGGYNENGYVLIDGTPTTPGNYSITVQAITLGGVTATGTFSLNVVQITTASLPDYEVGIPYFETLSATGGSGNYGWSLDSGILPDGLFFDPIGGTIKGTPTGVNSGTMPIVFTVIDITCEKFNPVFTPQVSLVTSSVTTIATLYGYSEYIASSPPKKYKKLTWSGTAEQKSVAVGNGAAISDALYVYSGSGEIDSNGNQISNYRKDLFTPCPATNFTPLVNSIPNFGLSILKGYCWPTDPNTCPICNYPPQFKQNEASNSTQDVPSQMLGTESIFNVLTPTSLTNSQGTGVVISIQVGGPGGAQGVPQSVLNGFFGCWLLVNATNNYKAVLSEEYTDTEALANAEIINSNGRTAENFPRTTGFVSRFTIVNYGLNCTNLVVGSAYKVIVKFIDSNFVTTTLTETFTASAASHVINHNINQPAPGNTLTVYNPTITFA